MSAAIFRVSLFSFILVLVTGCGGSSGGNSGGGGGGGNPTTVTFTFSGGAPSAVAAKIGSGDFTAETLTSGRLSLSISSGTSNFAVAFVCTSGSPVGVPQLTEQTVFELAIADGTVFTAPCSTIVPSTGQTGTLSGSVDASAIAGASLLNIEAQNGEGDFTLSAYSPGPTANFSIPAPTGSDRVEVLAYNSALQGFGSSLSLVGARDFSSQIVPGALNGGSTVVLGAADQVTPEPITYQNVPSGFSAPSTSVDFDMGGKGAFLVASSATTQYPALPAGAVESGDFYSFLATAHNSLNLTEGVSVDMTSNSAVPVSITFPAPWSYAGPVPAALPAFDFVYSGFSGNAGVIQSAGVEWSSGNAAENFSLVIASANYQNGGTTITFPNLSGLTGFPPAPASGTQLVWSAQIAQSNYGLLQTTRPSNLKVSAVLNGGFYTAP